MHNYTLERRPEHLREIFQGLFLLALRKGATIASVGIHGTAFAISDNGRGWTRRAFEREFPAWDLGRRLHELGCVEVQVVSGSRRGGWSTARLPPIQLTTESQLHDVSLPATGNTIAFTLSEPIEHPEKIVELARGVIPLGVRLDRQVVPRLHEMKQAWFRIRTEDPPGEFALNDALQNRVTVDRRGLYRPLSDKYPRSVFVPDDLGDATFQQGLEAASAALQAKASADLHRRPELEPQEVAQLIRRYGGDNDQQDPTRLVEFGLLLGYAAAITTGWDVSKTGVERTGFQLARLSRKTCAVGDLGKESAAILATAGFDVTTSELAPDGTSRGPLHLTSLDAMPYLHQTLEAYSSDSVGVEVLPCKTITAGRRRLPWVVITPEVRCFQADGEDLGDGPSGFVAIEAHDRNRLRRLLWDSPHLLHAFAWLMTTWEHDQLDWCLYRDGIDHWCLNQHRVRVILFETLSRVARWESPEKDFTHRARALEEQLDPALTCLTATAPALEGTLREPLLSLEPHITELENIRKSLWHPAS
jgi:hypothetical protein